MTADDLDELVIAQPLDRQQLFDGLARWSSGSRERFEAAWHAAEFDNSEGRWVVEPDALPQVIVPNPAGSPPSAGSGGGCRTCRPSPRPTRRPAAGTSGPRALRSDPPVAGRASTAPGQNLILDVVSLSQFHWVTEQSIDERAHLGALTAWIDPPEESIPTTRPTRRSGCRSAPTRCRRTSTRSPTRSRLSATQNEPVSRRSAWPPRSASSGTI